MLSQSSACNMRMLLAMLVYIIMPGEVLVGLVALCGKLCVDVCGCGGGGAV